MERSPELQAQLALRLQSEQNPAVVRDAVQLFAKAYRESAVPSVGALVLSHSEPEVVAAAVHELLRSCGTAGRELVRSWVQNPQGEVQDAPCELGEFLIESLRSAHAELALNLPWADEPTRAELRAVALQLAVPGEAAELPDDYSCIQSLMRFAREYNLGGARMAFDALRRNFGEAGRLACRELLAELRAGLITTTDTWTDSAAEERAAVLAKLDACLLRDVPALYEATRIPGLDAVKAVVPARLMSVRQREGSPDAALVTLFETFATCESIRALGALNAEGNDDARRALLRIVKFSTRHTAAVVTEARIGYWRRPDVKNILAALSSHRDILGEGKSVAEFAADLATDPNPLSGIRQLAVLARNLLSKSVEQEVLPAAVLLTRRCIQQSQFPSATFDVYEARLVGDAVFFMASSGERPESWEPALAAVLRQYEASPGRFRPVMLELFNRSGNHAGLGTAETIEFIHFVVEACARAGDSQVLKAGLMKQLHAPGLIIIGLGLREIGEKDVADLLERRISELVWPDSATREQARQLALQNLLTPRQAMDRAIQGQLPGGTEPPRYPWDVR